jgi:hypothetical protein
MWALHARQVSVQVGWPLVAAVGEGLKFGKGCTARVLAPMHKGLACMHDAVNAHCGASLVWQQLQRGRP